MTEPTDAEIWQMWMPMVRRMGVADPVEFARVVLAKWGTPPAVAGEPVAWLNPYGGVTQTRVTGHDKEHFSIPLYTAPLPVVREPLTDEQIHAIYDEVARREPYAGAVTRRNIVRAIEAAHGIKGGQHGAE